MTTDFIQNSSILDFKDDTIVKYAMKFKFVIKFGVKEQREI